MEDTIQLLTPNYVSKLYEYLQTYINTISTQHGIDITKQTFTTVPNEIVIYILAQLNIGTLKRFDEVSKHYNNLLSDKSFWIYAIKHNWKEIKTIMPGKYGDLKALKMYFIVRKTLEERNEECKNIECSSVLLPYYEFKRVDYISRKDYACGTRREIMTVVEKMKLITVFFSSTTSAYAIFYLDVDKSYVIVNNENVGGTLDIYPDVNIDVPIKSYISFCSWDNFCWEEIELDTRKQFQIQFGVEMQDWYQAIANEYYEGLYFKGEGDKECEYWKDDMD